jgi:hypothetical protein
MGNRSIHKASVDATIVSKTVFRDGNPAHLLVLGTESEYVIGVSEFSRRTR